MFFSVFIRFNLIDYDRAILGDDVEWTISRIDNDEFVEDYSKMCKHHFPEPFIHYKAKVI